MTFALKLAGIPIGVAHRYSYIASLCQGYLCEDSPAFCVSASDAQLAAEYALGEGRFSMGMCESICLHREIVNALVKHGVLLMHSAVIAVDGAAYVFMAKSGVGKSTHIRLWKDFFGDRALVVNGDKPLFSFQGATLMAHGSPWKGKEGYGANISLPVVGICLLERGETNAIRPAQESEVVDKIFHQLLLPNNAQDLAVFMGMLNRILKEIPFYRLQCNMDMEAARIAWEGMKRSRCR